MASLTYKGLHSGMAEILSHKASVQIELLSYRRLAQACTHMMGEEFPAARETKPHYAWVSMVG